MALPRGPGATLLTADDDRRRAAMVLYPLRRAAHRMAADCERMLESLHHANREAWRDAVGTALLASRQIIGIIAQAGDPSDAAELTRRLTTLATRMSEPQERVVGSLTELIGYEPVSAEEEFILQDARGVRDAAASLFAILQGPRDPRTSQNGSTSTTDGEPTTGTSSGPFATIATSRGRARVLVVDDQRIVRGVLRRQLERLGCDVSEADNGRFALEVIGGAPPDLILTDVNMPEMDGMQLLKALKAAESTREIPVIVISSLDGDDDVVKCLEEGAEDYVAKPFRPLVLAARVQAALDRKRMRDLERDYRSRVSMITSAAEAVERGRYAAGMLDSESKQGDALGRLARVFDRMVGGLKSRQERLQRRLGQLRSEMGDANPTAHVDSAATNDESPFHTGEILAARYEILGTLGRGGMGTVYRARDLELKDDVAVKVVRRDLVRQDPTVVQRLKSEIRLARKLSHRNVVRLHDIGEWKGAHFISMEHVRGITVADLLDRRGRLSVESSVAVGAQLAEALAVAHEQQIIHRDIKPANLLVDESGVLKVMDFGIARSLEREEPITLGGFIVGTPEYMAPEQLMGGAVDERSDLFAVGVVLYECLAGRPPFDANSPTALLGQMVEGNVQRLSDYVTGVPQPLEDLIYQLLRFQQSERPESARELADKLNEIEPTASHSDTALLHAIDIEIVPVER